MSDTGQATPPQPQGKSTRSRIFEQIEEERAYQDKTWGREFDAKNTTNDWVAYIIQYLGSALAMNRKTKKFEAARVRRNLLKAVTIGVAALEHLDGPGVAPRHYDVTDSQGR